MNALALVNAVLKELRQPVVATLANAEQYVQNALFALNATAGKLASGNAWPFLEAVQEITLATGTPDYALAADHDRILADPYMNDPALRLIPRVSELVWGEETLGRTLQGTPAICHLAGGKIWFWYVPDAAHNGKKTFVRYQKKPAELAADADVSPFDDYVLITGAVAKVKTIDGDVSPADVEDHRDTKHSYLVEQRRQTPRFVPYRDF